MDEFEPFILQKICSGGRYHQQRIPVMSVNSYRHFLLECGAEPLVQFLHQIRVPL
jgi:hypothetical protein